MNKQHLPPGLNARFFQLPIFVFLLALLAWQAQAKHTPPLFAGNESASHVSAPAMDVDLWLVMGADPANPAIYSTTAVTVTVLNNGTATATGVKVKFPKPAGVVYSGGNEWTTSQGTFAGFGNEEWSVGSVAAGSSATLTVHYFMLTDTPVSAYAQVIAANETDTDSQPGNGTPPTPVEDDEAATVLNNGLPPDLTISGSWTGPPTFQPGGQLFFYYYLANEGDGAVMGTYEVKAWISTDQSISADDIATGPVGVWGDTPANWFYQIFASTIPLPANIAPGQYYLIFKADADDVIAESNESNNLSVSSTTFTVEGGSSLPDFQLNSFGALQMLPGGGQVITPNSTVTAGNSVSVFDMYVTGGFPGPVQTYQYSVALRLSADANFDASDVLLASQARQFTVPSANYTGLVDEIGMGSSVIPANTPPGNYFLILKYDSGNAVGESNENNNTVALPIVVVAGGGGQIDLSLALQQLTASPAQWSNYSVKATISNAGPQAATGVKVKFAKPNGVVYVGGNTHTASQGTFTPFGTEEWNVGSIPANGSATLTVNYFLLQATAPTAYAQVTAANETDSDSQPNNGTPPVPVQDDEAATSGGGGPTPQPDLTIADLQIPNASVAAGAILSYNFDASNIGTAAVPGNFTIKSYISTDQTLSANDTQNGTITTGNYGIGLVVNNVAGASTIPASLAAGSYFLIVKIDADGVVAESNENNNVLVKPFTVTSGSGGGNPDCNPIVITSGTGNISIAGASAPHLIIKVFKPNWTLAFECLDGTCANPQLVNGLNGGNHFVEVKLFDAGWGLICTKSQTVNVNGGGINLIVPDDRFRLALDKFYPNPTAHWLNVVLFSPKAQTVTLDFYNQQGRRVHTLEIQVEEGRNTLELPVSDWKSGTYNVIARGEGLPAYGRFLKVWEE